jgi:hypothetical protein
MGRRFRTQAAGLGSFLNSRLEDFYDVMMRTVRV